MSITKPFDIPGAPPPTKEMKPLLTKERPYDHELKGDIAFGADPEFPLFSLEGKPIPAARFFPAAFEGKLEVMHPNSSRVVGSLFRDGYAVELNPGPWYCRQLLMENTYWLMRAVLAAIKEKATFGEGASVKINLVEFAKEAPPDCLAFGCSPSKNAYRPEDIGIPDIDAMTHPWRYMGKHFHFSDVAAKNRERGPCGMSWSLPGEISQAVKHLDLFCTVPIIAAGVEGLGGRLRRRFYGKAGEYREGKTYVGLEYRTPGGPLWRHPSLASFTMGMARTVLRCHDAIKKSWDPSYEPLIEKAINTGNRDLAKHLAQETKFAPISTFPLLKELGESPIHWAEVGTKWWIEGLPPGWGDFVWDRTHINSAANAKIEKVHWPSMRQTAALAA